MRQVLSSVALVGDITGAFRTQVGEREWFGEGFLFECLLDEPVPVRAVAALCVRRTLQVENKSGADVTPKCLQAQTTARRSADHSPINVFAVSIILPWRGWWRLDLPIRNLMPP
jgi:hypothetical protein